MLEPTRHALNSASRIICGLTMLTRLLAAGSLFSNRPATILTNNKSCFYNFETRPNGQKEKIQPWPA